MPLPLLDIVWVVAQQVELKVLIPVPEQHKELPGCGLHGGQATAWGELLLTKPYAGFGSHQLPLNEVGGRAVFQPGQGDCRGPKHPLWLSPLLQLNVRQQGLELGVICLRASAAVALQLRRRLGALRGEAVDGDSRREEFILSLQSPGEALSLTT